MKTENKVTARSLIVGAIFAALFAVATVYCTSAFTLVLSATQIPVLPFVLLLVMVSLANPICRLIKVIRPFSPTELMIVFVMGFVSGGVSTFGLSAQVIPLMGDLFNSRWNTDQTEWNRYVEPFVSERFFVAEPGIQAAAKDYRNALGDLQDARKIYDVALTYSKSQERLAEAEKAATDAQASAGTEAEKAMLVARTQSAQQAARQVGEEATAEWTNAVARYPALATQTVNVVAQNYAALIKERELQARNEKDVLAALESKAFAVVEQFRRGLPPDKRAVPGFLPMPDDTFLTYHARYQRMKDGHKALKELEAAIATGSAAHVENSIELLRPLADLSEVDSEVKRFEAGLESVRLETVSTQEKTKVLSDKYRFATRLEKVDLKKDLDQLATDQNKLDDERKKLTLSLQIVTHEKSIRLLVAGTVSALDSAVKSCKQTGKLSESAIYGEMRKFAAFDASLRRYFLSDVPWHAWIPPLLRWGLLIGLTYLVLMAFNLLIFRQWAYNEKLIYPLVQIPEELAGVHDEKEGAFPAIFGRSHFWIGVLISFSVLGWNLICKAGWIPGLNEINLKGEWDDYIKDSVLKGLVGATNSQIFFTMIGLAFLIPQKISFSLWFFTVLYLVEMLVMIGLGYGVDMTSFPADYGYLTNFRFAEGSGALVIFSLVVLFKCRKYILCFFSPSSIGALELDERKELRAASGLFIFGSIGLILVLSFGMGANLGYTIFFYFVVLLVTIGLIRAVTEGGILGFQAWSSPFHFIRTFVGMDKLWTSPSLFAPLYIYFMVFFFDLKTFIAPAMANSIKIRDDLRMRRWGFHGAIALGLLVAVVAALLTEIMMSYYRGADAMEGWFYSTFPKDVFNQMTGMSKTPPMPWATGQGWMITGAVVMALLLYFRQVFFWLPHPLGLIMLVNPIMRSYWFSIMIGWMFKSLVTKYGNRDTYAKARDTFLGLIVGEIIVVALAALTSVLMGKAIQIGLNRN